MFNTFANILAMSQPGGGQSGSGSLISMLVMFGAVILIMYFLMIRPQQKRQKEHQKMLENLKKGDKVVTTAGIHGTITDIDGSSMILQVSDNVKITFEKSAIAAKK
ncbi:MAG: preprotein translocase subunit YajC [Ignavibacteria bacterium GWB2_35_12]|nr:MAG: preprotein translocase subunit YajC [Ignavibacteria bacterium GWA2_35_8]OGU39418.1 MAG: preprotein translocase subunit YajC [Ignavibacteria bacterium GWB2_35_12]OGU94556.1 MAG: preprotein translocase subunit YajC [Ignavibacteria bacterium RIFOXYA2_FULL_35_10]OGV22433.1 MAG: preprotein translocase subunit YajC [Ignavibacteria bacterium RIFOXYC2_FULL_35_21]